MSSLLEIYFLTKLIKILTTNWTDQPAFKLELIDKNGKRTSKVLKTSEEKNAYSLFWKFAFNLKRLIESFPGGKSKLAKYITAYAFLKESNYDGEFGSFLAEMSKTSMDIEFEKFSEKRLDTGEYILLHETVDDYGNLLSPGDLVFCNFPLSEISFFGQELYEVFSKKTKRYLLVSGDDIKATSRRHFSNLNS